MKPTAPLDVRDAAMPLSRQSKTRAFLDTMKLLDGLTAAQIQALAKLARSLGGIGQSP